MKVYITDICSALCPTQVDIGREDSARSARIKATVFENIGESAPNRVRRSPARARRVKKTLRTALIAAALAALMGATAYAVVSFAMERRDVKAGEGVTGYWTYVSDTGEITEQQKISFKYASMVLSFTGPDGGGNKPELRCFWLPSEPTGGVTDPDGWTSYLTGTVGASGNSFPYIVSVSNVSTGNAKSVINGSAELVQESDWGAWHVLEITSDYSECRELFNYENDTVNYILLFDAQRGYLVTICGTSSMETLKHIARELEVRESDTPYTPDTSITETIGQLEPGRG